MNARSESWGRFLARGTVLSLMVMAAAFVGNRLANAGPGEPVRKALTVSGVLTGAPASAMATFRFYRAMGDSTPLCAPEVPIRDGMERDAATGAFSVEVPLDQSGTGRTCPDTLFHDPSAYVEVAVGTTVVVTRRPVNPVPYAVYAQQYGTPDCPVGYELTRGEAFFGGEKRHCVKRRGDGVVYDEVVRVGTGAAAFWIDMFEATVWQTPDGSRGYGDSPVIPFGTGAAPDYPSGFPSNGQWAVPDGTASGSRTATRVYALSRSEPASTSVPERFIPSTQITWFQAQAACRASGKRLPTGDEWLEAATGSDDGAGTSDGADGRCVTNSTHAERFRGRNDPRRNCLSWWGAQDMIGNVWEWTAEWAANAGAQRAIPAADAGVGAAFGGIQVNYDLRPWPAEYRSDSTWNISSTVSGPGTTTGLPAAFARGGYWANGSGAGVFAMNLDLAPSSSSSAIGFRCVIPR